MSQFKSSAIINKTLSFLLVISVIETELSFGELQLERRKKKVLLIRKLYYSL